MTDKSKKNGILIPKKDQFPFEYEAENTKAKKGRSFYKSSQAQKENAEEKAERSVQAKKGGEGRSAGYKVESVKKEATELKETAGKENRKSEERSKAGSDENRTVQNVKADTKKDQTAFKQPAHINEGSKESVKNTDEKIKQAVNKAKNTNKAETVKPSEPFEKAEKAKATEPAEKKAVQNAIQQTKDIPPENADKQVNSEKSDKDKQKEETPKETDVSVQEPVKKATAHKKAYNMNSEIENSFVVADSQETGDNKPAENAESGNKTEKIKKVEKTEKAEKPAGSDAQKNEAAKNNKKSEKSEKKKYEGILVGVGVYGDMKAEGEKPKMHTEKRDRFKPSQECRSLGNPEGVVVFGKHTIEFVDEEAARKARQKKRKENRPKADYDGVIHLVGARESMSVYGPHEEKKQEEKAGEPAKLPSSDSDSTAHSGSDSGNDSNISDSDDLSSSSKNHDDAGNVVKKLAENTEKTYEADSKKNEENDRIEKKSPTEKETAQNEQSGYAVRKDKQPETPESVRTEEGDDPVTRAQKKRERKLRLTILIIVLAFVAGCVTGYVIWKENFAYTNINLTENIRVKYNGTTGYGTANVVSNKIRTEKNSSEIRQFVNGVSYKFENNGKLKNGEKTRVKVIYSSELASKARIRVTSDSKALAVNGLSGRYRNGSEIDKNVKNTIAKQTEKMIQSVTVNTVQSRSGTIKYKSQKTDTLFLYKLKAKSYKNDCVVSLYRVDCTYPGQGNIKKTFYVYVSCSNVNNEYTESSPSTWSWGYLKDHNGKYITSEKGALNGLYNIFKGYNFSKIK